MTNTMSQSATSELKERANRAKEDLRDSAAELRGALGDVKRDVRDLTMTAGRAAREQLDPVEAYIREYPLRTVLMAAGAGLLLGAIFRRSR
jgi:ElaB/YqjD/DUF883 family membrane-anchored ribosome-binding protein